MGRRTSKKSKKNLKRGTNLHNFCERYRETGKKMLSSGTYKSTDRFMRKARANAQVGELFTPTAVDDGKEIEQEVILTIDDWHMGNNHNPFEDIREAMREFVREHYFPNCDGPCIITGRCSICSMSLTYKYPEDYPDDWKFCCSCKPEADKIANGEPIEKFWNIARAKKIRDKITLVKGNDRN